MARKALALLAAAVGGYFIIALCQTLFLEVLLGGRVTPDASIGVQLAGLGGTILSGVIGGSVVSRAGGGRAPLHLLAVLAPLALDTVYVIRISSNPLWFDLVGSLTLMAATVAGWWLWEQKFYPARASKA